MSSFLDGILGSSDDSAQNYLKQALAAYQTVNVPTVASETVSDLPQETVQGTVNPEKIQVADQGPTAFNDISLDPATRQAQINALRAYQEIADSGGLDANAKLAIQEALQAAQTQSQGAQGAIQQQAQAEGQGGGDFALTQRAIAAQGASNNAANTGMAAAAEAEANREAALNQMSTIGGNVNASDYNQAANKASSANTINATNTAARNAANTADVSNNMAGQTFNVSNAQGVNANNTVAKQNQVYYNANLPQQQFNNEIQKASGISGVSGQQATAASQAAANNSAMTGKLLGAAGTVAGAALGGPVGAVAGNKVAHIATGNDASAGLNAAHGGVMPCYASGGAVHDHGICMKIGGYVDGTAAVPGDSEENDTVHAMLSPGEVVIPRSVPKDAPHIDRFLKNAPVAGTNKKVDLTSFTNGYKRGR